MNEFLLFKHNTGTREMAEELEPGSFSTGRGFHSQHTPGNSQHLKLQS